jgi:solute:Na+ symporter, SSS family
MLRLDASALDYTILAIYFLVVLGIGVVARMSVKTDIDFFLSGRSLPAWITGLAFIAANLGALEILGMAANGAQYGVATVHFYWIGAVPAMVFLGIVMMPFYYGAKVRSVPEYLRLRFNEPTHALNAGTFAVATILIAGVNLFALALIVHLMLGWSISTAIIVAALIVMAYITLGGLTSAIYNEVLQFFIIVAALLPLTIVALHSVGGWSGLEDKVRATKLGDGGLHAWQGLAVGNVTNPIDANWIAIVFGLGFVLSFGYWTTNFAEVQRALSAKNLSAARRTPLIGAYPKILIPALTIIPGLVALVSVKGLGGSSQDLQYNNAIPLLIGKYFPEGMLGLAVTGLLAAFMAGVAANVTSFNTVFTYDLWQSYVVKDRDEAYYLRVGRFATAGGLLISVATAFIAKGYDNIMNYVQLLQRAAVRHVHHRDVLEAIDAVGGVLGADRRLPRRVLDARAVLVGDDRPRLGAGGELLGRDHRLRRRRRRDHRRVAGDAAQTRRGAARPRLGADAQGGGSGGARPGG